MLKYILLIALPVCVFAQSNSDTQTLEQQCNAEKNKQLNSTYEEYNKMLTSYIEKKDSDALENLKNSFIQLLTIYYNKTCVAGNNVNNVSSNVISTFVIDLIEFAIEGDKFTKFTKSNGVSCVDATKTDIKKCAHGKRKPKPDATKHDETGAQHGPGDNNASGGNGNAKHDLNNPGKNNDSYPDEKVAHNDTKVPQKHNKIGGLIKKASLKFDEFTCAKTEDLRKCVGKVMKNHTATCNTEHAQFIDSLFEFSLNETCSTPSPKPSKRNGANSFSFNTIVILVPLVGAMLIK